MVLQVRSELKKQIAQIHPQKGICEALKNLKKQSYKLGILSSNSRENIHSFLEKNNCQEVVDFIYTGKHALGKDKILNRIIKENKFNIGDIAYIGDEIRDIEAAKKSGIFAIAVSWGFNKKSILLKSNPDYIADKPEELIEIIQKVF